MSDRTGSIVVAHRRLPGATSSSIYAIRLKDGRDVVLRQLDNAAWLAVEPDLATHEFAALKAARRARLPAPAALAVDPDGGTAGLPSVLMSYLPGRVVLPRRPSSTWITRLALSLANIHSHRAPTLTYAYRSWTAKAAVKVPNWSADSSRWQRAIAIHERGPPRTPRVFLHRDFHPTNVLWQRGRVTGVVDWINACRGPRGVDVAHCRANLARMYGVAAARSFLARYAAAVPGYRHHPYWDMNTAFDSAAHLRFYRPWAEFGLAPIDRSTLERRLDAFVADALP